MLKEGLNTNIKKNCNSETERFIQRVKKFWHERHFTFVKISPAHHPEKMKSYIINRWVLSGFNSK